MSENPKKPDETAPTREEKPAKFTVKGPRALGFKVPETRSDGFIIPSAGPIRP